MIRKANILIAGLAFSCLVTVPHDALADTQAARRAAQIAEVFIARNDYRAAVKALSAVDCQDDSACKTLVDFSYGWVYEFWASAKPKRSMALLGRALTYYQSARKASPKNIQILTNLALVARRMGDIKTATGAITEAIKLNPDDSYQSYLFLGDMLLSAGDNKSALRVYKLAIKENPTDALGPQRLLEFYRKTDASTQLFKYSLRIRREFQNLAALGFEYTIGNLYQDNLDVARQSLTQWTTIRSDLGALTAAHLEKLPSPETWSFPGIQQLRAVVFGNHGPPSPGAIAWWAESAERQDAMARLLRLKAITLIAAAERVEVKPAERLQAQRIAIEYLTAAVKLAPQYYRYLEGTLAGSSNVKLDAATNLVTLHHSLKAGGDSQGLSGVSAGELSEMTEVLFSGKGGAYAAGQLSDIQRYHTVLGMIYYETRQDNSNGADNATFQLKHALETAGKIAARNPEKYEPLPELRILLAEVYQRQGKTADSARETLSAAMGFLETDNLPAADKALVSAKQKGANTAALSTILTGRQAVLTRGAALLKVQPGSEDVTLSPEINWLQNASALGLPESFVEGQRFKTLADLGTQLTNSTNPDLAKSVNALALDAASKNKILTSPTDLKRIQRLEISIEQSMIQTPVVKPVNIEVGVQSSPAKVDKPSWKLPSTQGTVEIQIDQKLLNNSRSVIKNKRIQNKVQLNQSDQ